MPRPRTGTIEPYRGADGKVRYFARVRLADGAKSERLPVPAEKSYSLARAKEWAARMQELEDQNGALLAKKRARLGLVAAPKDAGAAVETVSTWYRGYFAMRRTRGDVSVYDDECRFRVWIEPKIGHKAMTAVTTDDIEDIRDGLDDAFRAWRSKGRARGRLSGKSTVNAWSVLVAGFREAVSSKRRELRVKGLVNPCLGVQAPDRGTARRKPFVYGSEFAKLMACEALSLEWRETHAVACYTYARPGEGRVLLKSDVDLEHGVISITKAWDYAARKVKATKTADGVRHVPIHPNLMPLLRRMLEGKPDDALVLPVLSSVNEDQIAKLTRDHLKLAGVTRAELFDDTITTRRAGFRTWRDTGITWLAIAGVDIGKIRQRAGHQDITTTMGYVKAAEVLIAGFGEVFPTLPASMIATGGGDVWPNVWPEMPRLPAQAAAIVDELGCERRDLKQVIDARGRNPSDESDHASDDGVSADPSKSAAAGAPVQSFGPMTEEIKRALDAGDLERAATLLAAQLQAKPSIARVAPVVNLASRRKRR